MDLVTRCACFAMVFDFLKNVHLVLDLKSKCDDLSLKFRKNHNYCGRIYFLFLDNFLYVIDMSIRKHFKRKLKMKTQFKNQKKYFTLLAML